MEMWIAKVRGDKHENHPLNDTPMRNRGRTSGDSSSKIIAPRVSTWMVFAVGSDGPAAAMMCGSASNSRPSQSSPGADAGSSSTRRRASSDAHPVVRVFRCEVLSFFETPLYRSSMSTNYGELWYLRARTLRRIGAECRMRVVRR